MKSKAYVCSIAVVLLVSAFSGLCFASDDSEPVIYDTEYAQLGFKAHSWITGSGSQTIAHTQILNSATGTILTQIDKKCEYSEDVQQ
ncbi:MAG TPA: hypothetical protein VN631_00070 [Negativicutes bacterium]|nr:hypothetical protein [Negativicutes bacterium]